MHLSIRRIKNSKKMNRIKIIILPKIQSSLIVLVKKWQKILNKLNNKESQFNIKREKCHSIRLTIFTKRELIYIRTKLIKLSYSLENLILRIEKTSIQIIPSSILINMILTNLDLFIIIIMKHNLFWTLEISGKLIIAQKILKSSQY